MLRLVTSATDMLRISSALSSPKSTERVRVARRVENLYVSIVSEVGGDTYLYMARGNQMCWSLRVFKP
jgi:hypothetical protein